MQPVAKVMHKRRAPTSHDRGRLPSRKSKPSQRSVTAALLVEPRPDWHALESTTFHAAVDVDAVSPQLTERLAAHAQDLLQSEGSTYANSHHSSSSSHKFLSTIMKSGTWDDKISALTLLVQESPLHNAKSFESLLGIAAKRSRSQALMALGALKDLLGQGVVLPASRKLRTFQRQPGMSVALQELPLSWTSQQGLPEGTDRRQIVIWAYEDWLKRKYFEMIQILERWCNDEVEFVRLRSITYVWELLKEKPEQEENLLRLLVNKLGDSSRKVASRASYLLLQLQTSHPSMKTVILEAIEIEILLRPGQSYHAKYYAVITLNQTVLQISESQVANKLLEVYFSMFVTILSSSQKPHRSQGKDTSKSQHKFLELQSTRKPGSRKEAASKVSSDGQEIEEKIIAQVLTGVNRAIPFSTKATDMYEKHLDTLFRITHASNFNTSIQALVLIQQISTRNHLSTDRFYRTLYDSLLDPRLQKSSKQTMYLNLLYRSLKNDASVKRIYSFVKRLLQIFSLHEPPFICAGLYLIGELQLLFPGIKALLIQPETADEDETARNAQILETISETQVELEQPPALPANNTVVNTYDGRKRDPEYNNAHKTCLWEILPLLLHFHPSVSFLASRLLESLPIADRPDPSLHTMMHFLDRFAYRNAKARAEGARGPSIMQPALARDTTDSLFNAATTGKFEKPLNTETFWTKSTAEVAVDQTFFHSYFNQRARSRSANMDSAAGKKPAQENGDSGHGEGEDEVWKALLGSQPGIEGSDSGDDESMDSRLSEQEQEMLQDGMETMDMMDYDLSDDDIQMPNLESDEAPFNSSDEESVGDTMILGTEIESGRDKRRKLRHLPTFASAEEYEDMLNNDNLEDTAE